MNKEQRIKSIPKCILLSILTCGIYSLFWIVHLQNDLNDLTDDHSTSGGKVLFLSIITCGIYEIFWVYKFGQRIDELNEKKGKTKNNNSILFLALACLSELIATISGFFSYLSLMTNLKTGSTEIHYSPLSTIVVAVGLTLYAIMQDKLNNLYED